MLGIFGVLLTMLAVTGSHMSRVSISDVGIAVNWSQASKVQSRCLAAIKHK